MVDELNLHEGDATGNLSTERALADIIAPDAPVSSLVAEQDGRLIGYALWCFSYETAWAARGAYLVDLYVRETARGEGVGGALLRAVARATRDSGGEFVWWTAYARNERARGFYRRRASEEPDVVAYAAAHAHFTALIE